MNAMLADALQDCLERVEAGARLDDALARYPRLADDLRLLVVAARLVRRHRPEPSPAFRARLQVALANTDLALPAVERIAAPAPAAGETASPSPHGPRARPRRGMWRPLAARLAGTGLAVLLVLSGMVAASADTRPGDWLYSVRRGAEHLRDATVEVLAPAVTRMWVVSPAPARPAPTATQPAAPVAGRPAAAPRRWEVAPRSGGASGERSGEGSPAGADARPPSAAGDETAGRLGARAAGDAGAASREPDQGAASQAATGAAATPTPVPPTQVALAPAATSLSDAPPPRAGARRATPATQPTAPPPADPAGPTPDPAHTRPFPVSPRERDDPGRRAIIGGQVFRDDDTPMARATVSAYPVGADGEVMWWWRREVRAGDDGRYRLDNLYPGRYKVRACIGGYHRPWCRWAPAASKSGDAEVINVAAGEVKDGVDVRFEAVPPWQGTLWPGWRVAP